ncbi:MAG: tape measure protein [Candidatus Nanopelagicaceae bacterium]
MAVRIDVPINISAEFLGEAILDAAIGKFEKLEAVTKLGSGKTKPFDYEFKFSSTGEKIFTAIPGQLRQIDSAYEGAVAAAKKFTNTQDGSLTSLRQSVNNLKQQRDAINKTNPEWAGLNRRVLEGEAVLREYMGVQKGSIAYLQQQKNVLLETARNENLTGDARYKHTQAINAQNAALRAAQGIQKGSLADLKAQRAEILALRDATRKLPNLNGPPDGPGGGPTWNQLNAQLKDIDGQINRLTPSFSRLVRALGTIATVQAGFVAVTSALSGLGSLVNSYTARQKDIESFNLALRNIGLTQAETTKYFKEAASTANALGAPVQQVEKSYKRMLPALRAVGATSEESSRFIEQITARTQTLGLNTEQSGRLLEAFAQVLSKGKLQSEELNQQISELDGAFRTQLAEAIGVTSEQLNKLIEEGAVTSDVFVKAVNKMANGAEELKKRVEEGTATIQQLQNNINNISVDTLGKIGKQIEPLIKSFLRIATSVAEFFNEFQRTEVFKLFVTVLNQAAKGVEIFVKTLLNLVSTVATLLSPVASIANAILGLGESFGGVIGIIINVIGGLVTLKGAIMALNAIKSSAESISKFSGEMTKLGSASQEAAARVSGIRGVFRGLSDLGGGIAGKLLQMTNGFLGISTAAKKAEQDLGGIRTVADMQAASIGQLTAAHMDLSLKLKEGKITTEDAQKALDGLNAQQKNNGETTQQTKRKIIEYGMSMDEGTAKTDKFTGSTQKAGTGLTNLGTQARATGAAIKGVLAESFIALVNPITLAIQLVGKFIQVLEAQKKAAESVDASFSDVYLGLQRTLDETAPKGQKVTKSVEQTSASLDKQNKQVESTGNAWKTAGVILGGVALVAGTVLTGGILAAGYAAGASGAALISAGVAAVGFKTVAAGTAITLGSMALSAEASKKAIENLEKSGQGKALLENYKRVDQQLGAVRARIQGLGQDINSTDFSKYAEGSVNLGLLEKSYGGLTASLRENIELEKQRLS